MSTILAFDNIENRHSLYRGEDCMKKLCSFLREHSTNVINYEKKKMLPATEKELKIYQDLTVCYICRKKITQSKSELSKPGLYVNEKKWRIIEKTNRISEICSISVGDNKVNEPNTNTFWKYRWQQGKWTWYAS